jgi:enamine deaminase RidA (YjgF/YER057c/UK114 family)
MHDVVVQRLAALGLSLPSVGKSPGNLLGYKLDRGQIFVSGQLPLQDGQPRYLGKVGDTIDREEGYEAAKLAALNVIAQLQLATKGRPGDVEIIKVSGFVNCVADFIDIPFVINGASDLFTAVFGDRGSHARFAIGVISLPRGVPVEIDVIARLHGKD